LIKVKPTVDFQAGMLKVNAGLNIVFDGDTVSNNSNTRLYLTGNVTYNITDQVVLYGGIDGDLEEVSLHTLVNENPYINQEIPLIHQNKELSLFGGIKGALFNSFSFNGGFSINDYKNYHFFINDPADSAKFDVVYDTGNVTKFNFFSEIGVDKTNVFRGRARFDFYAYDLAFVDAPWHMPSYKFSMMGSFNLFEKILFNSDLYTMGGIRAKAINSDTEIKLDPVVDLNFKLDYRYSDQVSMFMSFNNILSKNYERLYNYPSRGFMFMAGLTYAFDRL